jgi:hypothetical protein
MPETKRNKILMVFLIIVAGAALITGHLFPAPGAQPAYPGGCRCCAPNLLLF